MHKCDVTKELEKLGNRNAEEDMQPIGGNVIQSNPSWKMSRDGNISEEKDYTSVEMGPAIFDLYYWPQEQEQQPPLPSLQSHVRYAFVTMYM